VGFTDIDPYLLNLFQGKYQIDMAIIGRSTLQAIISNNILKIIYTIATADKLTKKLVLLGLGLITIVNILIMIFI
jgi:ABC-type transport system involved in cytochrome c biogenesis permease subunit